MTGTTHARIPAHLHRYIVEQNYARYSAEDQATWRYIMRQLKNFLTVHAHESYLDGLSKTGISIDTIPRIDEVDEHLNRFGWGAVPVSGFIPPAAFMEFQSIGVLPIASDMRTIDHLLYTPAPDIVHEAAGHAPILVHPEYAQYLRRYGEVARHSILSKEDIDQYEAIRVLSDIKEDPRSTEKEIQTAENRLNEVNRTLKLTSEAALLSRMNWWTAEYGLIGDIERPKIFGAGLLSSVGESRAYLNSNVKKIPLSVDCVNFSYDITEPQPQLFVARDFNHLSEVLDALAERLSYRRGGVFGLERAKEARTVNTVQLNSGLQVSGSVSDFLTGSSGEIVYVMLSGPCQLALAYHELPHQGVARHPQGFSTPCGVLAKSGRCLSTYRPNELAELGLVRGRRTKLEYASGIVVDGVLNDFLYSPQETLILITWSDCRVTLKDRVLFDPSWGEFDMAVGSQVTSVFGGPADRSRYPVKEDFVAKRIPAKTYTKEELRRHAVYEAIRTLRAQPQMAELSRQIQLYCDDASAPWLAGIELLELAIQSGAPSAEVEKLKARLGQYDSLSVQECIRDGMATAGRTL